jgi:FixJ family two-component response regulator
MGRNVYVIDDDTSIRRAFQLLLQSAGFNVQTFSSVNQFLENISTSASGILILDMKMPGMTGLDLLNKLAPRTTKMQIIAVSASDDALAQGFARELGAAAFFQKPVDGQALIDAINWPMVQPQIPNPV